MQERLGWKHGALIAGVVGAIAALYYAPFHEAVGGVDLLLFSFLAFFSPYAGIALLAGSVGLPDPPGLPLTSYQIVTMGFIANYMLSGRLSNGIHISAKLVPTLWPFLVLILSALISGLYHCDISLVVLLVKIMGAILMMALTICTPKSVDIPVVIGAALLGFATSASTYWLDVFGFPVSQSVKLYRLDLLRISARDPNATGMILGATLIGVWLIILQLPFSRSSGRGILFVLGGVVITAFVLPALVFTGSRAALTGLPVALIIGLVLSNRRALRTIRILLLIALGGLSVVLDYMVAGSMFGAFKTLFIDFFPAGIDTKVSLWRYGLNTIAESPIFGIGSQEAFRALNPYGIDVHNTYLEFAIIGGVPAFLTFLMVILTPLLMLMRAWRRGLSEADARVLGVATGLYTYCLYTIFFISVPGNKALWMSWTLLIVSLLPHLNRVGSRHRSEPRRSFGSTAFQYSRRTST
jgi:O-antigen ligase